MVPKIEKLPVSIIVSEGGRGENYGQTNLLQQIYFPCTFLFLLFHKCPSLLQTLCSKLSLASRVFRHLSFNMAMAISNCRAPLLMYCLVGETRGIFLGFVSNNLINSFQLNKFISKCVEFVEYQRSYKFSHI